MPNLTSENINKIVDTIIKYGNNPEVKKELIKREYPSSFILEYIKEEEVKRQVEKKGFRIIPNSIRFILDSLEKVGYKIISPKDNKTENKDNVNQNINNVKTDNRDSKTNNQEEINNNQTSEIKDASLEVQIFGSRDYSEKNINVSSKETQLPWENKDSKDIETIKEDTEEISLEKIKSKWVEILQSAKETSIAFYSLIVNATPTSFENNTLGLSFSPKHTYQMKQFQIKENEIKFKDLLKEYMKDNYEIKCVVCTDKVENKGDVKNNIEELKIFGNRNII